MWSYNVVTLINTIKDDLTQRDFPSSFLFVVICQYSICQFLPPFFAWDYSPFVYVLRGYLWPWIRSKITRYHIKIKTPLNFHRNALDKVSNFSLSLWLTSLRCWSFLNGTQCGNFVPMRHCCRWCQTKRRGEGDCEYVYWASHPHGLPHDHKGPV